MAGLKGLAAAFDTINTRRIKPQPCGTVVYPKAFIAEASLETVTVN